MDGLVAVLPRAVPVERVGVGRHGVDLPHRAAVAVAVDPNRLVCVARPELERARERLGGLLVARLLSEGLDADARRAADELPGGLVGVVVVVCLCRRVDGVVLRHRAVVPVAVDADRRVRVAAGMAAALGPAEVLLRDGQSERALCALGLLADDLDPEAAAATVVAVTAGRILVGLLVRVVVVRGLRLGRDVVGLRDVPAVAVAEHAKRRVLVARALLLGLGGSLRELLVRGLLEGDLDSGRAGAAVQVLVDVLVGVVVVRRPGLGRHVVRLPDVAVVAVAGHANRSVLVLCAELVGLRDRECSLLALGTLLRRLDRGRVATTVMTVLAVMTATRRILV